jgi:hypothetical protein
MVTLHRFVTNNVVDAKIFAAWFKNGDNNDILVNPTRYVADRRMLFTNINEVLLSIPEEEILRLDSLLEFDNTLSRVRFVNDVQMRTISFRDMLTYSSVVPLNFVSSWSKVMDGRVNLNVHEIFQIMVQTDAFIRYSNANVYYLMKLPPNVNELVQFAKMNGYNLRSVPMWSQPNTYSAAPMLEDELYMNRMYGQ